METPFTSRHLFHERLTSEVLAPIGTSIANLNEFLPAALKHGEYEPLVKFKQAVMLAATELEELFDMSGEDMHEAVVKEVE